MRRLILGLISLAMLAAGLLLTLSEESTFWSQSLAPMMLRCGILLGVLWIAFPQVLDFSKRVNGTSVGAVIFAGVVLIVRPAMFRYVVPIIFAMLAFQYIVSFFRVPRHARRRSIVTKSPASKVPTANATKSNQPQKRS